MKKFNQMFSLDNVTESVRQSAKKISSDTLEWLAIVVLHSALVPGLLAVLMGLTDNMPSIDTALLLWSGLLLMLAKSAVQRNMLHIITICLGFVVQIAILALTFFK